MKISMLVELKDTPGELIKVIEPISRNYGNIISIVHFVASKTDKQIPVQIIFEIDHEKFLDKIQTELKNKGITISEINIEGKRYYMKKRKRILIIGHVIDKSIRDTIDRINDVGLVTDLDVVMPSPEKKSSVLMKVEYNEEKENELESCLRQICDEKEFLLIEE